MNNDWIINIINTPPFPSPKGRGWVNVGAGGACPMKIGMSGF
jgi:hypothetical protein